MRAALGAVIGLSLSLSVQARAQTPAGATGMADLSGLRIMDSVEAAWQDYRKAVGAGDQDKASQSLALIRAQRVERNIDRASTWALALLGLGQAQVERGNLALAAEMFGVAREFDPDLPDVHFSLARLRIKQGPLHYLGALSEVVGGIATSWSTARGRTMLWRTSIPALVLALILTCTVYGLALWFRYGALLRHDIEEALGASHLRVLASGICLALAVLPMLAFQGYAWLPLWWFALLFIYCRNAEKIVSGALLVAMMLATPLMRRLDQRLQGESNPLCRAGLLAAEGESDSRATRDLELAVAATGDDTDLQYLSAILQRKAGSYDRARAAYQALAKNDAGKAVALNNLADIEFANGEFDAAKVHYKAGLAVASDADLQATLYYNLSLTYLQTFEYQPAQEARSNADRLARGLVQEYEPKWRYLRSGSFVAGVVDWLPSEEQVLEKFAGYSQGAGRKNSLTSGGAGAGSWVVDGLANRLTALFAFVVVLTWALVLWRGQKMFTMRCLKCGMPFCKHCHLGASVFGLCTQCHHLFVVRDGVSGPARNRKLLEVQHEEDRRGRLFRILSLFSPGAGHMYGRRTVLGVILTFVWYLVLSLAFLALSVFPILDTSSPIGGPWLALGLAPLLLIVYVYAARARPDFEVMVPIRRGGGMRRPRMAGEVR